MRRRVTPIRTPALLALCILTGCEVEAPVSADASIDSAAPMDVEPDAGDPMCFGPQVEPLMACTPPTDPETACALTVESGGRLRIAATFDEAGRLTSHRHGISPSSSRVVGFDADGRQARVEAVEGDCVVWRAVDAWAGDRRVERTDRQEGPPTCTSEVFVGDVLVERSHDTGCDCVGAAVARRCAVEDGRPVRCESWDSDGRSEGVETWSWTADGLLARAARDHDGDGVEDQVETFEYDAAGRVTVQHDENAVCEGEVLCDRRWTWVYEGDRTTRRVDLGDDGSVDRIDRTTVDRLGRRVLDERSVDGGETWTVQAWTREVDGARATIIHTRNGLVQTVVVEETDGAGRLLHRSRERPGHPRMTLALEYDAAGRIVQERHTIEGGCPGYAACTADYRWDGENCPDLRVQTDADVAPQAHDVAVGIWCTIEVEGC